MASIFHELDRQSAASFWTRTPADAEWTKHSLRGGPLWLKKGTNVYSRRECMATQRFFLAWKTLESFVELSENCERYGFRLHGQGVTYDFYAKNESDLVYWLEFLAGVCINSDIEEDYQIGQLIGSRPRLFYGTELLTNERVLIKRIPAQLSEALTEVQFLREYQHPSILKIQRVYEDPQYVSLVLELAEAYDLIKYVQDNGILPLHKAKQLISRLAGTCEYLEDQGLVFEQYNVANVLVTEESGYLQPILWRPADIKPGTDSRKAVSKFLGKVLLFVLTGALTYNSEAEQWKTVGKIELEPTAKAVIDLLVHPDPQQRLSLRRLRQHPWVTGLSRARTLSSLPSPFAAEVSDSDDENLRGAKGLELVSVKLPVSEVKSPGQQFAKTCHISKTNSL